MRGFYIILKKFLLSALCVLALHTPESKAQRLYEDSKNAALTLGQWFSNTAAHYDFLSASPLTPLRSRKIFLQSKTPYHFSSDYGVSYMIAPLSSGAINAIQYFQSQPVDVTRQMKLTRLHAAWSVTHDYDFSISYIYSDQIDGWGLGLRRVLKQVDRFYISYRLSLAHSRVSGWYRGTQLSNEVLASFDTGLIDFYGGLRHTLGEVTFESSVPELQLPGLAYFAGLKDTDVFAGAVFSTTTNTRVTLQTNYVANELKITAKLSLRFDELYPVQGNWFRKPGQLLDEKDSS